MTDSHHRMELVVRSRIIIDEYNLCIAHIGMTNGSQSRNVGDNGAFGSSALPQGSLRLRTRSKLAVIQRITPVNRQAVSIPAIVADVRQPICV